MSWYIGLGRTSCENETWSSHRSSRPYGTVRVPDMDPPPSSAISLFILVHIYEDVLFTHDLMISSVIVMMSSYLMM